MGTIDAARQIRLVNKNEVAVLSRRHFCALLGAASSPAAADLYDDYINSKSKQPFVAFLGREGSPTTVGHAFVGLGVQIDAGLRVYERFFGLYPKDGAIAAVKSILVKASGQLDYQWADVSWDAELRKFVDDDQKRKVLAKFDEWNSTAPNYSLTGNNAMNCNGLVSEVAQSIGLKVPDGAGTTRPWKYIQALTTLNP